MCNTVQKQEPSCAHQVGSPPFIHKWPIHLNSLWSVWGGIFTTCLEVYLASRCVRRYTTYTSLPWPADQEHDQELNLYL